MNFNPTEYVHLKEYLSSRNLSRQEFADLIEVSESAIAQYVKSLRTPTLLIALRIQEATKGKVDLLDLLSYPELVALNKLKNKRSK